MMMQYQLQDAYDVAWQFAAQAHTEQQLPGTDLPYLTHIGWVAGEILISFQHEIVPNPALAVQCAILHDVLEDTAVGYDDLRNEFGPEVADGVAALTKDASLQRQHRMEDSLKRILARPKEIGMVKLADRISNLRTPPDFWDFRKISEYADESDVIISMLGQTSAYLSKRIKIRLENYRKLFLSSNQQ